MRTLDRELLVQRLPIVMCCCRNGERSVWIPVRMTRRRQCVCAGGPESPCPCTCATSVNSQVVCSAMHGQHAATSSVEFTQDPLAAKCGPNNKAEACDVGTQLSDRPAAKQPWLLHTPSGLALSALMPSLLKLATSKAPCNTALSSFCRLCMTSACQHRMAWDSGCGRLQRVQDALQPQACAVVCHETNSLQPTAQRLAEPHMHCFLCVRLCQCPNNMPSLPSLPTLSTTDRFMHCTIGEDA